MERRLFLISGVCWMMVGAMMLAVPPQVSAQSPEMQELLADANAGAAIVFPGSAARQINCPPGFQPTLQYFDDFEGGDGGWTPTLDWEWGTIVPGVYDNCDTAGGDEPTAAYSGTNVWATNLDGCYTNAGAAHTLTQTFDFSTFTAPVELSLWNWRHVFGSFDYAEIFVNGDLVWSATDSAVYDWAELAIDVSAYAGNPSVTIEFSVYTTTVVNRAGWYLDDVTITSCEPAEGPNISLNKTVGTVSGVCAATDAIAVVSGTTVYYCYEVENIGTVPFEFHTLVDDQLGTLLTDFPWTLNPTDTYQYIESAVIAGASVTNNATWTASDAMAGYAFDDAVSYGWIDITGTGTPLGLTDDGEADVTMPFNFTFYGTTTNLACIGNNGGLLLDSTGCSINAGNGALPSGSVPLGILPFWDDIDSDTGDVYYETLGTEPNRMFVVEWFDRPHFSNTGSATFEVVLYEGTNEILFQYEDLDFGSASYDYGASATVGLNMDATAANQYSYNTAVLDNGMAILWSPVLPAQAMASDSATVDLIDPDIAVTPSFLATAQLSNEITVEQLTIENQGGSDLTWSIVEAAPLGNAVAGGGLNAGPLAAAEAPPVTDGSQIPVANAGEPLDCAAYQDYPGREPAGYADQCLGGVVPNSGQSQSGFGPTDTGYALDIGFVSDNFVTFTLNDFPGQTVVGQNAQAIFGMDFDSTGTILYGFDNDLLSLGTIDTATGAWTTIGPSNPAAGHNLTGLAVDPTNDSMWASSTDGVDSILYTVNPANGALTQVGSMGTTLMIDISINSLGQMYGHDIGTDSIYTIDMATGAATLVGATGYDANFAQGMDFDNDDGTLYIFLYIGGGANVFGTVDLATGAVTPLATDNPTGEFEGAVAVSGVCSNPSDLPWLSVAPDMGTNAPATNTVVDVTFDSTGLTVGIYEAVLCVLSNDPDEPIVQVPVTMDVLIPVELMSIDVE